jgi:hypothetical protein
MPYALWPFWRWWHILCTIYCGGSEKLGFRPACLGQARGVFYEMPRLNEGLFLAKGWAFVFLGVWVWSAGG